MCVIVLFDSIPLPIFISISISILPIDSFWDVVGGIPPIVPSSFIAIESIFIGGGYTLNGTRESSIIIYISFSPFPSIQF
uniref:Uncharacterized protein n=1 Tax=Helianthus annuus TaxID=4232 RepID=A0A251RUT5_HELAN